MKMEFIKSLKEKSIVESVDYETALLKKLEIEANKLNEDANPKDIIQLDVPLFLRLLEYAKEDAKTDMDLHHVTEKVTAISSNGQPATMNDYENIVKKSEETKESADDMSMLKLLAGLK